MQSSGIYGLSLGNNIILYCFRHQKQYNNICVFWQGKLFYYLISIDFSENESFSMNKAFVFE